MYAELPWHMMAVFYDIQRLKEKSLVKSDCLFIPYGLRVMVQLVHVEGFVSLRSPATQVCGFNLSAYDQACGFGTTAEEVSPASTHQDIHHWEQIFLSNFEHTLLGKPTCVFHQTTEDELVSTKDCAVLLVSDTDSELEGDTTSTTSAPSTTLMKSKCQPNAIVCWVDVDVTRDGVSIQIDPSDVGSNVAVLPFLAKTSACILKVSFDAHTGELSMQPTT
eukprot:m.12047 g.12047  ORF g.12047 m.12047 type:complete len:220 (-) comp7112_c0_seq1:23-682(-)